MPTRTSAFRATRTCAFRASPKPQVDRLRVFLARARRAAYATGGGAASRSPLEAADLPGDDREEVLVGRPCDSRQSVTVTADVIRAAMDLDTERYRGRGRYCAILAEVPCLALLSPCFSPGCAG